MITSKGSPFLSSPSAHARTLFRLARSSATSSKLPPLAAASFGTCAVAASAFFKSRAERTTGVPCAARERAVSTPSPAETPVTKIRLPRRLIPDRTCSVVEVAPNTSTIVFLLEIVAGPQRPVIQVAAWLTLPLRRSKGFFVFRANPTDQIQRPSHSAYRIASNRGQR